ncbi:DNA-binding protein HU [Candidatus Methylomirabilis limnetica]|jgi:DNA-binding protein HU-beta|uniref:DNA-binding protein HU n=1 Tax=Candidatus Methylomirabilis limnetica TaxID=2033718 RepID=A0A2T4U0V1_9BACT|nr:HU family DNA-binding protein [Candidatus Methylomirabilis limnetica]PTL36979.1 DNA-binding protein HU [Candidatus Methylomirabilis limnetica]
MTKTELAEQMAQDAGISKAIADTALRSCIDSITNSLKNGQDVAIVGFGTFSVASRAARTGRNPQTGEPIAIKASRVPRFKPGKTLKDAVNS